MINHLLLAYVWYLFHEYHWYPKFPQSSHHRRGSPSAELLLKTATRLNGRRSLGFGEVFEQSVPGAARRHAGRDVAWKKGFTQNILRKDHFCIKPSAEIGCHREKQEKIGRCQNHKLKGELCKMDRNWKSFIYMCKQRVQNWRFTFVEKITFRGKKCSCLVSEAQGLLKILWSSW